MCGACKHTVIDFIWLSPLFIDEDDGHQDDDLSHDAEEGPESSQAAADTQMDLIGSCAEFIGTRADVVSNVTFNAKVIDYHSGLVGGGLDLIFVSGAIDDWLKNNVKKKKQVRNKDMTILHNFTS